MYSQDTVCVYVYITVYISAYTPFMNFDYNVNFNN